MSWRSGRWWLLGLIVYLIFLFAAFPASYALAWLQKRLPEVQLAHVSGSIWSGAAQEFALHGQPWGKLQWHFDWLAPFLGHLGYRLQLHAADTAIQGRIEGTRDRLLLQDVSGHIPVLLFEPWLPVPAGSLSGRLEIELSKVLLVNQRPISADGVINLTDVSLTWPQRVHLGNYQLKLSTQAKNGIHGSFMDTDGPLILQGTLDLTPAGHYLMSGTLISRDTTNAALSNLLGYLPVDNSGHRPFSFSGQW